MLGPLPSLLIKLIMQGAVVQAALTHPHMPSVPQTYAGNVTCTPSESVASVLSLQKRYQLGPIVISSHLSNEYTCPSETQLSQPA